MVWVIVVLAVVVLALAAWAGTGRLGEMPEVVNDRPKGHIPDGPVDDAFLEAVGFPRASTGYDRAQVDSYLRAFVDGAATTEVRETAFDIVAGGYDMQAVDTVLDRMAMDASFTEAEAEPEAESEPEAGSGSEFEVTDHAPVADPEASEPVEPAEDVVEPAEDVGEPADEAAEGPLEVVENPAPERSGEA